MTKRFRARTSGNWTVIVTAALIAVPLVLLVVLPLRMASVALREEAMADVVDTSANTAVAVDRQINGIKALTVTAAEQPEFAQSSGLPLSDAKHPIRKQMGQMNNSSNDIRSVIVVGPDGRIKARQPTDRTALGIDVSDRDYFRGSLDANGPYFSDVFESRGVDTRRVVAVATPVSGPAIGNAPGVLVTVLDAAPTFQPWVDNLLVNHRATVTIFDRSGNVVAGPPNSFEQSGRDPRGKESSSERNFAGKQELNGESEIVSYSPLGNTGWTVKASSPTADAFAPVAELRQRVLLTGGLLVAVLVGVLFLFGRAQRARAHAEKTLEQSHERTQRVIDTAEQIFIELDGQGRITEWNRKAEESTGWTREDVYGQSIVGTAIPTESAAAINGVLERLARTEVGEHWVERVEIPMAVKASDKPIHIEMSMWTAEINGQLRLDVLAYDVTARKRLETERELIVKRQRQLVAELREADRAKSDFISTISHELRTPLTSIIGYLEMLREGYGGTLNKQQDSMLGVVGRNSQRLLSLIEDILMLSRLESGSIKAEKAHVDIASLVTGVVQTLIPSARDNQLEVEIDVDENVGGVNGDSSQLERVLLNLMSNAIKFTPEGGRVSVSARCVGDDVQLQVSDTGIGIAEDEQARVFNRFFRSTEAQGRAIQGTGLGLTIVRSIVERHGGSVSLQSAHEVGTTVTVNLPAERSEVSLPVMQSVH